MGTYVFRWPYPANDVHVTGTFDDWGKSEQLNKVGDIWEKEVTLPSADEKVLYKFVVDDQWIVDEGAPKEGDGHNNTNNVLYPSDIKRKETVETAPGAFPETPSGEQTFSVNPIPASNTIGNPISLTPGEPIPDNVNTNTVESTVTTSQEDYEKSGSSVLPVLGAGAVAATVGGIAGANALKKPEGKEKLIPESSLPMGGEKLDSLDAGPFIQSSGPSTTTAELASKVPLEKPVDPTISSVAANSTTAQLASNVPLEKSVDPTISSVASNSTTAQLASKVPLEKSVDPTISSAAPGTSAAALAANVPLEQKRQGMIVDPKDVATTSVPETVQESIGKAHQDPEAAASAEAVKEKSAVEKELLSKVKESEATGEPATAAKEQSSYHGLATAVPHTVEESMTKANAPPEAAADSSIVAEKTSVEQELLTKIPQSNESGQPAPTLAAATTATAPTTTATKETSSATTKVAAPVSDNAADPALADEPAVKMMAQNEATSNPTATTAATTTTTTTTTTGSVPPAKVTAAAAGVPTVTDVGTAAATKPTVNTNTAPSTPAKSTTPADVVSPASTAGTDKSKKKHKHRLSTIIKNIFK